MKVTYCLGAYGCPSISLTLRATEDIDWKGAMMGAMEIRGINGPYHELCVIVMSMGFVAIKAYLTETFQMLLESVPPEEHPGKSATFGTEKISIRVEW